MSDSFFAPEPLGDHHQLDGFTCGVESLDDWLVKKARTNSASGASRVFVVCDDQDTVVAYYSLSTGAVVRRDLPRKFRQGTPDPVPVLLIGRFAVASNHQKEGLGYSMAQDALLRCERLLNEVAFMFVMLHPVNDAADTWWRRNGFISAPTEEPMLLLPISQLAEMRAGSDRTP
ncbi:GNAT family N-acetyltransferase [Cellulosimicrobium funkei]|uniref:GNAT family N-acetyltransferase n=1 Tax=Cellulosimicrobium funkei TaxID=264251 RepID=UPI0030F89E4E